MSNIHEIFNHYGTGAELISYKELKSGHINQTYHITTDSKRSFILQKVNTTVFKDPLKLAHNFEMLDLYVKPILNNSENYIFPKIYSSGKFMPFYKDTDENVWRLMDYVSNTVSFSLPENPEIAYEASRGFGTFQAALLEAPRDAFYTTILSFRNLNMRVRSLKSAIKRDVLQRKKAANGEINMIIRLEEINALNHKLIKSGKIKKRITHNDPKPDNVLFDKTTLKGKAVIDFDTVQPGYLIFDFGDIVRSFCNPVAEDSTLLTKVDVNTDIFRSVAAGYLGELKDKLSPDDKEHLSLGIKAIIYMQSVRFLTDYLNGDIYYRINYPDHNLDRCRNQLTLLRQYIRQESEFVKILKRV